MSEFRCPNDGEPLDRVSLERAQGTVHGCSYCHGVWVRRELIEKLEKAVASSPPPSAVGLPAEVRGPAPESQQYYRPCPSCASLMDFKACGSVVVDVCSEHGVWFDPGKLESFIAWVQAGQPRSGTHHRVEPLAAFLGLAAPPATALGDGWRDAAELGGGVLELLVAVVEILAD